MASVSRASVRNVPAATPYTARTGRCRAAWEVEVSITPTASMTPTRDVFVNHLGHPARTATRDHAMRFCATLTAAATGLRDRVVEGELPSPRTRGWHSNRQRRDRDR